MPLRSSNSQPEGRGPRGSDRLDEIERRYSGPKRSVSPSPESEFPVRVTLPGLSAELRPRRLKSFLLMALAAVGFVGVPSGVAAWFIGLREARSRVAATEETNRQLQDEIAQVRAVLASHDRRIKVCEAGTGMPMVVSGKQP